MPNYAELQRRYDAGTYTPAEAQRHGRTHKAYGWGCNPPGHWSEELQQAYTSGYKGEQACSTPAPI